MGALRWLAWRSVAVAALTVVVVVTYAVLARPQVQVASARTPFTLEGYLHTAPDDVVFVYLGRSGSAVTGTLTRVYVDAASPGRLLRASGRFRGILDGSRIAFSGGTADPAGRWAATLSGPSLVLSYPGSRGSTTTVALARSTVAAFNTAVDRLQARTGTQP